MTHNHCHCIGAIVPDSLSHRDLRLHHVQSESFEPAWLRSSICGWPANAPPAAKPNNMPLSNGSLTVSPNRSMTKRRRTKTRPARLSISIESNRGTADEIAGYQALYRDRWTQDQREPRGCLLEGPEGNRRRSQPHSVRTCVDDRHRPPSRQSFVGDPAVRSRSLPQWRCRTPGSCRSTRHSWECAAAGVSPARRVHRAGAARRVAAPCPPPSARFLGRFSIPDQV